MNKTPRTDKYEQHWIESGNARKLIELTRQLETELADIRGQFAEYVKAECEWMESLSSFCSEDKRKQYRIKASELREKAKETLGL